MDDISKLFLGSNANKLPSVSRISSKLEEQAKALQDEQKIIEEIRKKRIERKNAPQKLKTDEQLKKIQTHQNNISVKILDRMKKFDASFLSSLTVKTNDPIDPIQIDKPFLVTLVSLDDYLTALENVDPKVEEIKLSQKAIGVEGLKKLCESMLKNADKQSVQKLFLDGCDITNEGISILSNFLANYPKLDYLDLRWNQIQASGMKLLATALVNPNCSVTCLNLEGTGLEKEGGDEIGNMLLSNHTLKHLSLNENSLGDEGVMLISEALAVNSSLITLHLARNNIMEEGVSTLVDSLKLNTTLKHLGLSDNTIFDKCSLFANITSLETLEIKNNCIEAESITCLIQSLKNNKVLKNLDVSFNEINLSLELEFFQISRENPYLQIKWKDNGAESISEENFSNVVNTLTWPKIFDYILDGTYLSPLLDIHKLLQFIQPNDKQIFLNFFRKLIQNPISFKNGIDVFNQLLDIEILSLKPSNQVTQISVPKLPPLLNVLYENFSSLSQSISIYKEEKNIQMASFKEKPVGFMRLSLIKVTTTIIKTQFTCFLDKTIQIQLIDACLKLFLASKWNNLLHNEIFNFIEAIIQIHYPSLIEDLFIKHTLLEQIIPIYLSESEKKAVYRSGHYGIILKILQTLQTANNPTLLSILKNHSGWKSIQSKLEQSNKISEGYLSCETLPQREKTNGFNFLKDKTKSID